MDERLRLAQERYQQAVFGGDASGLSEADRALDAVEADLVLARGRLIHASLLARSEPAGAAGDREHALFERAVELYRSVGDRRGEAEARFWLGVYLQVVAGDHDAAGPHLDRALTLARQVEDLMITAYALRHLGIAAHRAGRLAEARAQLEESTAIRRVLGFGAGVAADLVGLAYLAGADQRPGEARTLLDEAEALAEADGAYAVLGWVREARAALA